MGETRTIFRNQPSDALTLPTEEHQGGFLEGIVNLLITRRRLDSKLHLRRHLTSVCRPLARQADSLTRMLPSSSFDRRGVGPQPSSWPWRAGPFRETPSSLDHPLRRMLWAVYTRSAPCGCPCSWSHASTDMMIRPGSALGQRQCSWYNPSSERLMSLLLMASGGQGRCCSRTSMN